MAFALGPRALAAGYRLASYESIGSTSNEAFAWARLGDPGRLWVVARMQTEGHGRRGRSWQTPHGNLAASLLMLQSDLGSTSATLGFAAGLALESAIRSTVRWPASFPIRYHRERLGAIPSPPCGERVAGPEGRLGEGFSGPEHGSADPSPSRFAATPSPQGGGGRSGPAIGDLRLKWPNDVLMDGFKVAGVLLEAVPLVGASDSVVIGIGVNVRRAPEGIPYAATSLAERGVDVTAEALFEALAEAWVEHAALWNAGHGFAAIRDRWLERAAGVGAQISVKVGEITVSGTFETIDEEGRLIVRAGDGTARLISAGEVHFGTAATVVS